MPQPYLFDQATPADDAAIRHLLATSPVPGSLTLTYEREPDYLLGCGTMGRCCQVMVCRHLPDDALVALACRATRPLFVNGQVEEVGYLGQLRIAGPHRGSRVLSQGFRLLREWHNDGRVAGYITTVIEDNAVAEGVLIRHPRRHFPAYREVDRLCTLALVVLRPGWLRWRVLPAAAARYSVSRGSHEQLGDIVAFLQHCGAARQFFPYYTEADFCDSPLTLDFQPQDFVIARRDGMIVGVVGLWDQSRYKQTVVQSYSRALHRLRPGYNLAARITGAQPMPQPGEHLRYAYASFVCVQEQERAAFAALLWQVYGMAAERGYTYLMLGLTTSDPLLAVARRYPHLAYYSRLYTVGWDDSAPGLHTRLDGRIPYVEIAAL